MRNFLLILFLLILAGCNRDTEFQIAGQVDGHTDGAVRLSQFGESHLDSEVCQLNDGTFYFSGNIPAPEQFMLIYEKDGPQRAFQAFSFFLDPSDNVEVVLYPDSIERSLISGSKLAGRFVQLERKIESEYNEPLYALGERYERAVSNEDEDEQEELMEKAESINKKAGAYKLNYIAENPRSYIAAYLLHSIYRNQDTDTIKKYFDMLSPELSDSKYYNRLNSYLSLLPGNPYQDFELTDGQGETYRFSNIADGKTVLIDFWASWCQPCRDQNATLASFHEKYRSQGFEIVGISIDRDTSLFLNTIKEDSMTWINLLDRTEQEPVSKLYETGAIPSNILIDKDGIITYKDIGLKELESTIKELLKE